MDGDPNTQNMRRPEEVFEEIRAKLRQYCLHASNSVHRTVLRKELKALEEEYERLTGRRAFHRSPKPTANHDA
jgi:hypothetical protein